MQAKIAQIFGDIGLDGAKLGTYDNPGPLEPASVSCLTGATMAE